MPQGGQPIEPGLIARVVAGVRYAIRGVAPDTFFGPGQPQAPGAQEIAGRRFDYQVGYNYRLTPRNDEAITFSQLRALADGYDLLRLVIETRKDQIEAMEFSVRKRDTGATKSKTDGADATAQKIEAFLRMPDQQHTWSLWLRQLLEELFVIDAPVIYPRLTRGGDLYSLDLMDGATIKPVLDDSGRTPVPPDVAYQQVIKGLPAVDYSRDELLYLVRNLRVHKVYGYSPVEQIIATVNIALRRQLSQLQYYSEGNVPEALIGVPATWQPDQIRQFQEYWDSILEGNTAQRRHAKFIPGDIAKNYVPTKEPILKDEYDDWLARIVCFAFSIPPTAFVKQTNRAVAENAMQQAKEEGIAPLLKYIKSFMDTIIARYFKQPGYEFAWRDDEQVDPVALAQANDVKVRNGTKTINEARADDGLDPLADGDEPMIYTATGPVLLADVLDPPEPVVDPMMGHDGGPPLDGEPKPGEQKPEVGKLAAGPFVKAHGHAHLTPIKNTRPQVNKSIRKLKRQIAKAFKEAARDVGAQAARKWPAIATVTHVTKMASSDDSRISSIIDALDLSGLDILLDPTEAEIERIFGDAGKKALSQIGITDQTITSQVHQDAVDYAAERAAELVGKTYHGEILVDNPTPGWSIKESTRDMLRSTIGQAIEEGWSSDRLASEIEDSAAFSATRAETIARTELAFANTNGAMTGYRASGVVVGKVWLLGEEACDECLGNADAGQIGIDDMFPSGDDAPPAHPNCVCDVAPIVGDDSEETEE
jgi:hypothetical protein